MRILIVDDDEHVAQGIRWMLSLQGYEVECHGSAEAAMTQLAAGACDLVISDLRLPGLSGLELFECMAVTWPQTRRILITGFGSNVDGAVVARLADDFLTKPFSSATLLAAVERTLARNAEAAGGDPPPNP